MILNETIKSFDIRSNKIIFLVVCISVSASIIDTTLIRVYDFITMEATSEWRVTAFIIISVTCSVPQIIILNYIKAKVKEIGKDRLHFQTIHKMVTIGQYTLIVILGILISQILLRQYYDVGILIGAITLSYTLAVLMMSVLSVRFFTWFASNRNSVILLYGIASAALAINAALTVIFVNFILLGKPPEAVPHVGPNFPAILPGSLIGSLNQTFVISSIVSFILTWAATAVLLHHYSQNLGRIKYWIIVSLPLVYFLSQFLSLSLNVFLSLLQSDPIFFGILLTFAFSLSKAAGGIFFGIAFWTMSRGIKRSNTLKEYLTFSAYGIVMLFISNQAVVLVSVPYPPFGVVAITFVGLSSYLMLIGIYFSAISVSQDINLRQYIHRILAKDSKLLDGIGTAQMQQEIERKVLAITKERQGLMEEETGVQSSFEEEDIKGYLDKVMEEIKKTKN